MKGKKIEIALQKPVVKTVIMTLELGIKVDLWLLRSRFMSSDYLPEFNYKSLFMRHRALRNTVQVTPQGKLIVNAKTETEGRQDLQEAAMLIFNVIRS